MSHLEGVLLFAAFFAILTSAYGLSSTIPDVQSATNVIFAAWPAPSFPVLNNCASTDLICVFKTANAAAAYPGIALLYGFTLLYSAASRVNAMFTIFQILLFGGAFQAGGVPILGLIMTALIISALIEVFRIVRGSSSGV